MAEEEKLRDFAMRRHSKFSRRRVGGGKPRWRPSMRTLKHRKKKGAEKFCARENGASDVPHRRSTKISEHGLLDQAQGGWGGEIRGATIIHRINLRKTREREWKKNSGPAEARTRLRCE